MEMDGEAEPSDLEGEKKNRHKILCIKKKKRAGGGRFTAINSVLLRISFLISVASALIPLRLDCCNSYCLEPPLN